LFHTSSALERRLGKRVRAVPLRKQERFESGPWWRKPAVIMQAPISKTYHPINQFKESEEQLIAKLANASQSDLPVQMDDPYKKEAGMCTLCPRRFSEPVTPSYKNPKLLSQFVSPHTGRVYQSHITGLCTYMQGIVEKEVERSRGAGFMSTRVRDPNYLQDPSLFNPSRPVKPNPF